MQSAHPDWKPLQDHWPHFSKMYIASGKKRKGKPAFKGLEIYQPVAMCGIYLDHTSKNLLNKYYETDNIEHNEYLMTNDF